MSNLRHLVGWALAVLVFMTGEWLAYGNTWLYIVLGGGVGLASGCFAVTLFEIQRRRKQEREDR